MINVTSLARQMGNGFKPCNVQNELKNWLYYDVENAAENDHCHFVLMHEPLMLDYTPFCSGLWNYRFRSPEINIAMHV